MEKDQVLKEIVREKYGKIAQQEIKVNASSCCGATPTSDSVYNIMSDNYTELEGYNPEADLGLGCGLPTQFAHIKKGDTVIDLGSGAGNDCFIARHETGPEGKVLGIDFTQAMIEKARMNAEKLGFNNIEFRYGDIENMPVSDEIADVVVSNCVLNLVPDKNTVFHEIFRVLKPGAHFSISDIVLMGDLPESLQKNAEMYAGCVSGAIQKSSYLQMIQETGFINISVQKEKRIELPIDILKNYLEDNRIQEFLQGDIGIFSITVYAEKPLTVENYPTKSRQSIQSECEPGKGCC